MAYWEKVSVAVLVSNSFQDKNGNKWPRWIFIVINVTHQEDIIYICTLTGKTKIYKANRPSRRNWQKCNYNRGPKCTIDSNEQTIQTEYTNK